MVTRIPARFEGIEVEIPGGKGIYPPSEDTFLLLDMVKRFVESQQLVDVDPCRAALDMGSGAGLATIYLARHFTRVDSIDINPGAVAFVKSELLRRGQLGRVTLVAGSLLDAFRDAQCRGTYSLACFNPPYLPPEDYECPGIKDGEDDREHAFYIDKALYAADGGKAILEQFLRIVKDYLVPGGHVFFVKSSLTGIEDTSAWATNLGFTIVEKSGIHAFFEDIEAYHAIA
ncbi:MAG: methyltransferase domain-containing protein [Candidatus Sigynarchaeota archaeon]